MPRKPEQYLEASSHFLALSAGAQYIQTIAGTLDTCSHSHKVAILEAMEQLIDRVTEALVESSELKRLTENESNFENGKD